MSFVCLTFSQRTFVLHLANNPTQILKLDVPKLFHFCVEYVKHQNYHIFERIVDGLDYLLAWATRIANPLVCKDGLRGLSVFHVQLLHAITLAEAAFACILAWPSLHRFHSSCFLHPCNPYLTISRQALLDACASSALRPQASYDGAPVRSSNCRISSQQV